MPWQCWRLSQINTYTGLIVGVASATTTLSAGYLGRLGDRLGYRKVLIGAAVCMCFGLRATFLAAGVVFMATCILANLMLLVSRADENSDV